MSRVEQVERQLDCEADALGESLASGEISNSEFNDRMRDLQRDARDAYEQDREDALEAVRDEWGGW